MNASIQWQEIAAVDLLHRPQIQELRNLERDNGAGDPSITLELLGILSSDLDAYAVQFEDAISVGDYERAGKVAHAIKGAAQTGGLKRLEHLAHVLESEARAGKNAFLIEAAPGLIRIISDSIQAFESEIKA